MRHFIRMTNIVGFVLICLAVKVTAQDPPDISLVFYIDERSENGTLVGTVVATDPDMDNPTFSIVSGNEAGAFLINTTSGDLTVADEDQLDFDVNPSFTLLVEANDGNGGITDVDITINLIDLPLGFADSENQILVYPNPVVERLFIDANTMGVGLLVTNLYSMGGDVVSVDKRHLPNSKIEMDMTLVPTGIYVLRISTEERSFSKRILVR